jgi:hypothetical protein
MSGILFEGGHMKIKFFHTLVIASFCISSPAFAHHNSTSGNHGNIISSAYTSIGSSGGGSSDVTHSTAPQMHKPELKQTPEEDNKGTLSESVAKRKVMKPISDLNNIPPEDKNP